MAVPAIQYIPGERIDRQKWDSCLSRSPNGLLYAYSFYLDHMAIHWDGLVLEDYRAIMPLPWNSKYGIRYIYQPFLTAQLGLFGADLQTNVLAAFINAIPSSFRLVEMPLNSSNMHGLPDGFAYQRSNFILDLREEYEVLYNRYRDNIKRNLKKSSDLGCTVSKSFDVEEVIQLALQQMKQYEKGSGELVRRFRNLFRVLLQKGQAITYGIRLGDKLIASCVFFYSPGRAYYILVGNHPDGKTIGASHALIDAFVRDHAGKEMVLDFEGSDIPSLAFFYSSFGAVKEIYPALKINRLPFYLRWMK